MQYETNLAAVTHEGRSAFFIGQALTSNPYDRSIRQAAAIFWTAGWVRAKAAQIRADVEHDRQRRHQVAFGKLYLVTTMKMIRLQRTPQPDLMEENWPGNNWILDTRQNQEVLEKIMLMGIARFGPGSYWLESQDA